MLKYLHSWAYNFMHCTVPVGRGLMEGYWVCCTAPPRLKGCVYPGRDWWHPSTSWRQSGQHLHYSRVQACRTHQTEGGWVVQATDSLLRDFGGCNIVLWGVTSMQADAIIKLIVYPSLSVNRICKLISRCQGYSRVIKVIQFLPVYIFIITR